MLTVPHHNYCEPGFIVINPFTFHSFMIDFYSGDLLKGRIKLCKNRQDHRALDIHLSMKLLSYQSTVTEITTQLEQKFMLSWIKHCDNIDTCNAVMTIIIIMMILAMLSATWQRREREQEKKGWRKARRMTCIIVVWGQQGEGMGN